MFTPFFSSFFFLRSFLDMTCGVSRDGILGVFSHMKSKISNSFFVDKQQSFDNEGGQRGAFLTTQFV